MVRYVSILKAKQGELAALEQSTAFGRGTAFPVLELVPNEGKESATFVRESAKRFPAGRTVAIDTTYLDSGVTVSGVRPLPWIAGELRANGVTVVPVVRPSSLAVHLADAKQVNAAHSAGVMLRLGDAEADPTPLTDADMRALLRALSVSVQDLDLVLDAYALESAKDVTRAGTAIDAVSPWATALGARTVTLAAGAFRQSISDLPRGTSTSLPRHDAALWKQHAHGFDFGDYAVNHPSMPSAEPRRGPKPNLRYTYQDQWLVWREDKVSAPGYRANEPFYALCDRVVAHPAWSGAAHCWGDDKVSQVASRQATQGGATQWRSYGTSHHIETVVNRLATLGEP